MARRAAGVTAIAAAFYPMRLVARLPIASTLRNEVVSCDGAGDRRADASPASFAMPAGPVVAVRDVSLDIAAGDYLAVRGPSGCGKSTLLHMLGCVDTPSRGTLLFEGRDVATLSDRERSLLRLRSIGFVFQRFFLLPMLTAAENVELPQSEAGAARATARRAPASCWTTWACRRAPIIARRSSRAARCSGWRSPARWPTSRACCWPTSRPASWIEATGEQMAELLDRVNRDGTALVIVTHDPHAGVAGPARC